MKNPYYPKCDKAINNIEFNTYEIKDNVKSTMHVPTFGFIQCGTCGHVFGVIDTSVSKKVHNISIKR